MTSVSTQPMRHPDARDRRAMSVRAGWLIALNLVLPGSAQIVAGNRRLGRFGLLATLVFVVIVVAALVTANAAPAVLATLVTQPWALWTAQGLGIAYVVVWVVLTLDTLRLVRLVSTGRATRWVVAVIAVVGCLVPSLGAVAVVQRAAAALDLGQIFAGTTIEPPVDGRYNILLLGGDSGRDRYGLRPDSITVVSVDAETGQAAMIGIPRNQEYVPFVEGSPMLELFPNGYDCGDECLINYVYTEAMAHPELYPDAEENGSDAGIEATRDAAEAITGLTIQYYVLIDMAGFEDLIDALGGIDIDVKERLPVGGHLDETTGELVGVDYWLEPGVQHLDGHDALWYGRSRATTNDYDRMKRQKQVQKAVLEQVAPASILEHFNDLVSAGKRLIRTDVPAGMLGHFVDLALKSREEEVLTLDLVPDQYNPAHPDYEAIHADIAALLAPRPEETSTTEPADG